MLRQSKKRSLGKKETGIYRFSGCFHRDTASFPERDPTAGRCSRCASLNAGQRPGSVPGVRYGSRIAVWLLCLQNLSKQKSTSSTQIRGYWSRYTRFPALDGQDHVLNPSIQHEPFVIRWSIWNPQMATYWDREHNTFPNFTLFSSPIQNVRAEYF